MKKWNELPSLTKFIVFSFTVLIIYSVIEFVCAIKTNVQHDVLTQSVFFVLGGEVLSCALIKVFKLRNSDDETDGEE